MCKCFFGGVKVFLDKRKVDFALVVSGCRAASKKYGYIEVGLCKERLLFGPTSRLVWFCRLTCRESQGEYRKRVALQL